MKRKTVGEQHEEEDTMVLTKQRMRREQRALVAAIACQLPRVGYMTFWKIFVQIVPHPMNFIAALFAWNARCR